MKKLNYLIGVAGLTGILLASQVAGCSNSKESTYQKAGYNESKTVTNVTTSNQLENIISSNEKVAVDFGATWCPPCRKYGPIFEAAAESYKGKVVFCKVTLDELSNQEEMINKYDLMYIPKTVLFKDGKEVHSRIGYIDKKELSKLVDTWLLEKK